jgi:type II secretory pathway pseudopilin PulG
MINLRKVQVPDRVQQEVNQQDSGYTLLELLVVMAIDVLP